MWPTKVKQNNNSNNNKKYIKCNKGEVILYIHINRLLIFFSIKLKLLYKPLIFFSHFTSI